MNNGNSKSTGPVQTPRQRCWLAIRNNKDAFNINQIANLSKMKYESAREFVACLNKAKIVEVIHETPIHHENCVVKQKIYRLVKDIGYTAPQVSKRGEIIKKSSCNKAMWNTLRITQNALNYEELAQLSSNDEIQISQLTAREYLRFLYQAGYLKLVSRYKTTGGKNKFQLFSAMNTGPIPPQIQRAKQVFDPNTNQVMYSERPELEEELKHGTLLLTQEEIDDE